MGDFMNVFEWDRRCKTVKEAIEKYKIPDDWTAEFQCAHLGHPNIFIPVERIRKFPAILDLRLFIADDRANNCSGFSCPPGRKRIVFQIARMGDLIKALETEQTNK